MSSQRLAAIASHLNPKPEAHPVHTITKHSTLNTRLRGVTWVSHGVGIEQFRGIKYGKIAGRFQPSQIHETPKDDLDEVDCTKFGPVCPQNYTSPAILLRVPEDLDDDLEPQDEFECLNLTITVPASVQKSQGLPVFVWIYGGSQMMTFGSLAGKICDPQRMVADSVRAGTPVIVVAMNYRLNIFGFGNGDATNLALKDQALAIEWIRKHIAGFGGNPDNITLAGESAGAVYTHAHAIVGTPIKRVILQSGSLFLSPPMQQKVGKSMLDRLCQKVQKADGRSLQEVSAKSLLQHVQDSGISAFWLQAADGLEAWQKRKEAVEALMVGDCEYDSAIWRNGVEVLSPSEISACFDKVTASAELKRAYGIYSNRETSCKLGALDFINDRCFAMPACDLRSQWRKDGRNAYQYIIDQPNPWQPSSRSHHAVDLVLLFGGYDLSFDSGSEAVGAEMRRRWLLFVNGNEPWAADKRMAFGPVGRSGEIDDTEYSLRRRTKHFELLKGADQRQIVSVFSGLAAGRLSIEN